MKLSGWGRHPAADCRVADPADPGAVAGLVAQRAARQADLIARGNGRAYGDAALNPALTLRMGRLDRMIAFDADTGVLEAEAGVLLGDVIAAFLPRGWFPMVTPGTRFVTLGGMAAADVHGKNHHLHGSFRACVLWLDLVGPDGVEQRLTPGMELFDWTLGGMGLTGVITRLALQLIRVESGWIRQRTLPAPNLAAAIEAFEAHQAAPYSVAWIDCLASGRDLGRSLVMLGEHARRADLPPAKRRRPFETPTRRRLSVPFSVPGLALNRLSVGAFNRLYYWNGTRAPERLVDWQGYFYPLDAILHWNRIYGRRGLVQFQCVLPLDRAQAGLTRILQRTAAAGQGSFLAVLKRFGPQDSAFSFPMEGYTLALDFPARPACLDLVARLEPIVRDHGGRLYLAKDARMTAARLAETDPRAAAFRALRVRSGAAERFASLQSRRLGL